VDVHGLSTVETRAAVLSVLQALRERRRARLAVSGDLVIVTGTSDRKRVAAGAREGTTSSRNDSSLRDAVEGLARDLDLKIQDVERNAGRLVVRESDLLRWLDRDRSAVSSSTRNGIFHQTSGVPSDATTTFVETACRGVSRRDAEPLETENGSSGLGNRLSRPRFRRSKSRDVPGLEGALKEWLRANDSSERIA
jgi:hypothetical protein